MLKGLARLQGFARQLGDPFGWTAERRAERALIGAYEARIDGILSMLSPERLEQAVALARVPERIRGFGPVKAARDRSRPERRFGAVGCLSECALLDESSVRSEPMKRTRIEVGGYEEVWLFEDGSAGLEALIAIHDTTLGRRRRLAAAECCHI